MHFESKRRHLEKDSLNRLERDITLKKDEVKRRYNTYKENLELEERELNKILDQIYANALARLNERNKLIANLNSCCAKLGDCKNNRLVDTYEQSIAPLNEKIYELRDDCIIAPNIRLDWNEEAIESTGNLCSFRVTSAPYKERIYPEWTAVENGEGENEMLEPNSLILANGEILVSDLSRNAIQIFNKQGAYLSSINHPNLHRPTYMHAYKNSLFVSCDGKEEKVLKFVRTQGGEWEYENKIIVGHSIAALNVDDNGVLYIFLSEMFKVFAVETACMKKMVEFELKTKHFVESRTQIMDAKLHNGEWYILFANTEYPLQCFDKNGKLTRTVIPSQLLKGALHFCMDPDGNIITTEEWKGQVSVFTNNGEFISSIGSSGDMEKPRGVDIDEDGRVFICDLKSYDMLSCY